MNRSEARWYLDGVCINEGGPPMAAREAWHPGHDFEAPGPREHIVGGRRAHGVRHPSAAKPPSPEAKPEAPGGAVGKGGTEATAAPPRREITPDVDRAIKRAADISGEDVSTMRSYAGIESNFDPEANRNKRTQYKGLFQLGNDEWRRFGRGDIFDPADNAEAMGRLTAHNKAAFRERYGRDPTPGELYLTHQQGLGFYTQGAMTNIRGNLPPGAPAGARTHEGFERYWTDQVERRRREYGAERMPAPSPGQATGKGSTPAEPLGPGGMLRASPGRNPNLSHVDPRLTEIMSAAASHLPEGYRVTVNEGYTPFGHAARSQHHVAGRGALDLQIWDPAGNRIPNRGADTTGMYRELGQHAYGEMLARHPELKGWLAHGAAFETSRGSGVPDLMHYDTGGERGGLGPHLSQIGAKPGVKYGQPPPRVVPSD